MSDIRDRFYKEFNIKKIYGYKCSLDIDFDDGFGYHNIEFYFDKRDFIKLITENKVDYATAKNIKLLNVSSYCPFIKDEVYLGLIAILNEHLSQGLGACCLIQGDTVGKIKDDILLNCIKYKSEIYEEVKELFKVRQ